MAYFANGSEGCQLDCQCDACPLALRPCPVFFAQSNWNYDQLKKGNENVRKVLNLLIDESGTCLMRNAILDAKVQCCPVCDTDPEPMSDVIDLLEKRSKE